MVTIDPKRPPKGIHPAVVKTTQQRQPRGTKDGGRFAPGGVSSESEVELVEDQVGYEPDGSKAFEERSRKSTEKAVEPSDGSVPLESDAAAFEKEFGVRATEPDPWVKRTDDVPSPASASPSPIKLGGAVEYAEGSWQYPPPPTLNTAKMAAYWSNVLIPDNALQNLENADRDRDFFAYEEEYRKWVSTKPSPTTRYRKKHPEGYAEFLKESLARKAIVDRVQFHLGLIPRHELRDVARLAAFWEQASGLGEESVARAAATEFVTSSGQILKPLDVVQKYRTWEISGALYNRVRYSRPD
jgi:hypothetical protein